jgi:hypothetical protein
MYVFTVSSCVWVRIVVKILRGPPTYVPNKQMEQTDTNDLQLRI